MEDAPMDELRPDPLTASATASASSSSNGPSLAQRRTPKEKRMRLEKVGMYRIGRTLGHGNFAQVKVGYHEIANTKVAVKIVDTQTLDPENLMKIEREIKLLQKLNHPFIIKLYEVIRLERYWYIITEYVGGGELFDMLTDKGKQPENEARRLFQQIVSAVAECHGRGIVHRDIKAENLLLDRDNNIKLIDFGFSNVQNPNSLLSTWCGSPPYAAPELLLGQEYDGMKSDVWSLGVILYILVTAGFPFPGDSVDKLKRAVLNDHLKIPFWVSVACSDLIRKMLTVTPGKRYSLSQVIQHRWFVVDMPGNLKTLMKTSLKQEEPKSKAVLPNINPVNLTVDRRFSSKPLDPAVMIFMQQHTNWSEEQIIEDVRKQNFEGPIFATYELLNSKLVEFKDIPLEGDDHPRRGSRGSIISGRANVEPEAMQNPIPAHHLARLSLSTSQDYDSDDSSASDLTTNEESSSPRYRAGIGHPRRRLRRNLYQDIPEQQPSGQRRHTLCAADRVPVNPLLPAQPISTLESVVLAMANLARIEQIQRQQIVQQQTINNIPNNMPFVNIPVSQERRASANEALLGLNSYAHLLAACSTIGMTATDRGINTPIAGQTPRPSVEEEGQLYLNHYGSSKRNTIHDFPKNTLKLSIQDPQTGNGISSLNGLPTNSLSSRHSKTPYAKQNGNERRSSWASSTSSAPGYFSPQQQAQLEKLYKQATGGTESSLSGVQQLQIDFQKLRACTQEQSNPGSSIHLQNRSSSMIPNPLLEIKAPTISITDENNRCLQPSSGSYDPLSILQKSNQPAQSQTMGGQQRPATVIGFAPASSTASTPENQPSNSMVKYVFIPVSLEIAIERLPRFTSLVPDLIFEVARDSSSGQDIARIRFSHNKGILFEMVLHRMDNSPNISKTEFTLISGDVAEYDALRAKLLAILSEIGR
ncbi:hypothetical protein FO519_001421 [Halicephalobus sp. NKZ332]|nr:hypothetical protein FO519_001421 [Halicephalobus sp. NKZ332]